MIASSQSVAHRRFSGARDLTDIKSRGDLWRILPLTVVVYAFLLFPPEARLQVAGVAIPIYRLLLICSLPLIGSRIVSGEIKPSPVDAFIVIYAVVIFSSFVTVYDIDYALKTGSGLIIDNAFAYLLARSSVRCFDDLRRILVLIIPALALNSAVMAYESLSNTLLLRPFFAKIFGSLSQYANGEAIGALNYQRDVRLGLGRGYATFSHPILAGSFLATMLSLIYFSKISFRLRIFGVLCCTALVFSLSSAAIILMIIVLCAAIFTRYRGFIPFITWPRIFLAIFLALVLIEVGSEGGVIKIFLRYTFSPQSGYYRLLIWEYGWKTIMNSPWVGIGYEDYERPHWMTNSIDTNYILLGVRNGILAPIALLGACFTSMFMLGLRHRTASAIDREMIVGVSCAIFLLMFAGITVAFFGEIVPWFMALIGIGASLAASRSATLREGVR